MSTKPTPFEISDVFTDDYCELDPLTATYMGVSGHDDRWTGFDPESIAARFGLARSASEALKEQAGHEDPVQANAAKVMSAFLDERVRSYDRGNWVEDLNHIASPLQHMIGVFDLMLRSGSEAWANIVARLSTIDQPMEGYRQTLQVGLDQGRTVAARQVESVITQAREVEAEDNRFADFPKDAAKSGGDQEAVADAVENARSACSRLADWLEAEYLPHARPTDPVGQERYLEDLDQYLGMGIDPFETYQWGWSEVQRLLGESTDTARLIDPDKSLAEVYELLDNDPERSAPDRQTFIEFVQGLQDDALSKLSGTHFEVPDEIKTVTVNVAPPGGPLGAWYQAPSEDFSRPGSIWYAPGERERLPYWGEVSTAYHEGFPGHHLQVGTATLLRDQLSRFHRLAIWYSGSGEGWALYAERLMEELGFLENPEWRLGYLNSQLFRAVRVVLDIGCQLELAIPEDAPMHAGETWSYDIGVDYMWKVAAQPHDMSESEVKRYLGWWGQAIAYKVGEREILRIREDAERAAGAEFDRADFHRRMLEAGAIRLDHLREVLI
jgi:uncharacterized protein (DUF885 family)